MKGSPEIAAGDDYGTFQERVRILEYKSEIRYRLSPCVYVRDRFPRIPSVNSEHKYAGLAKHNPELYPCTQKELGPKKTSRDIRNSHNEKNGGCYAERQFM